MASTGKGKAKATAVDVARFMVEELRRNAGEVYQRDIAWEIEQRFGDQFVYENRNGNLAIGPDVLSEFRKLTENTVVWERRYRYWRMREKSDPPGRMAE